MGSQALTVGVFIAFWIAMVCGVHARFYIQYFIICTAGDVKVSRFFFHEKKGETFVQYSREFINLLTLVFYRSVIRYFSVMKIKKFASEILRCKNKCSII